MRLFEILAGVSKGRVIPTSTSMYAWGQNALGTLGLNSTALVSSPTQIGSSSNWKSVRTGFGTGAFTAINSSAALYTWGYQVWDGALAPRTTSSPVQIAGSWASAAPAFQAMYGIKTDGSAWAWGVNSSATGRPLGTSVTEAPPSWSMLDTNGKAVLGIKGGTLYMWGYPSGIYWPNNNYDTQSKYTPTAMMTSTNGANYLSGYGYITAVSKAQFVPSNSGYAALALVRISPDGVAAGNTYLVGFGLNDRGALRSVSQNSMQYPIAGIQWDQPIDDFWATPANGVRYNTGVADAAVFMRTANGSGIWAYGHGYAALGINSSPSYNQSSPVVVMATNAYPNVISMAMGTGQTLALANTGALYAWGHPTYSGLSGYNVTVASAGVQSNLQLATDKSQPYYPDPVTLYRDGPTGTFTTMELGFSNTTANMMTGQAGPIPSYESAQTAIGAAAATFDTYQANTIIYDLYTTAGAKREITIPTTNGWVAGPSAISVYFTGQYQGADGNALAAFIDKLTNQTASGIPKLMTVLFEEDNGYSYNRMKAVTANNATPNFGGYVVDITGTISGPPGDSPSMGMAYSAYYHPYNSYDTYSKTYYAMASSPIGIDYSPTTVILTLSGPYADTDATDLVAAYGGTYSHQGTTITGGFVPTTIDFQHWYDGYFQLSSITGVSNPFPGAVMFTGSLTPLSSGYTGMHRMNIEFYHVSPPVTNYVPTDLGRISLKFNTTSAPASQMVFNNGGANAGYLVWGTGTWSNTTSTLTTTGNDKLLIPPPQTPYGNTFTTNYTPQKVEWARWGNGTAFSVGNDFKSVAAGDRFSLAIMSKAGANLVVSFGNNASTLGRTYTDANTAIPTVISYTNGSYSNTGANWKWVAASPYTGYMVNGDDYAIGSNTPFPNNAVFFTGNNTYYQAGGSIAYSANMQPSSWVSAGTHFPLSQNTFGIQGISHTVVANTSGLAISSGFGEYGQFGNGFPSNPGTLYTGVTIPGSEQILISSPVQVGLPRLQSGSTGENSWSQIVPYTAGAVALHKDKTLFSWGVDNNLNKARVDDGYSGISPYQISTSSFTFITVGDDIQQVGYALKADGTLWQWGGVDTNSVSSYFNSIFATGNLITPADRSFRQVWTTDVTSWNAVTTTGTRTWAIAANGTLWGWGLNHHSSSANSWPLGANLTLGYENSWTYVTTDATYGTVAAALGTEGQLYVWGSDYNTGGAILGMNKTWTTTDYINWSGSQNIRFNAKEMWPKAGGGSWTQVAFGINHLAALNNDGKLYFVGKNTSGEFGNGLGNQQFVGSPVSVAAAAGKSWTSVDISGTTTYATQSDGSLWVWGYMQGWAAANTLISIGSYYSSPVQVFSTGISKVFAGPKNWGSTIPTTAVIKTDGTLWGWNNNGSYLLNALSNNGPLVSSPVQMAAGSWSQVRFSNGRNIIAGIMANGTLWGWGATFKSGSNQENYIFNAAPTVGIKTWSKMQMSPGGQGLDQTGAGIDTTGGLWTWGNGGVGQLGNGIAATSLVPVKVGSSSWTQVSVGGSHMAAIDSVGRLFTWGMNFYGTLGTNTFYNTYVSSPVQVGSSSWSQVACNAWNTVAIDSAGRLFTWGYGATYTTGDGTTTNRSSPVQVAAGTSFSQISLGGSFCVAISTDGGLWTWGQGAGGQLGNGSTTNKTTPGRVGTSSWTAIASGNGVCHAIRLGGGLFGWGNNASGSVGNGSTANVLSPVQIGTSSWSMVAGTWQSQNRYGMISTTSMYAWGGTPAYHGINTTQVSRSSPTLVSFSGGKQTVPCGLGTVLATNGYAITWGSPHTVVNSGNNQFGTYFVFGNTKVPYLSSPIQLNSGSYTQVEFGSASVISAIKTDGTLWSWGYNEFCETGNSTATYVDLPAQVGTSSWAFLGSKMVQSRFAVTTDGAKWMNGYEIAPFLKEPAGSSANSGYRQMAIGVLNLGTTFSNSAGWMLEPTARHGVVFEPRMIDNSSWIMINSGTVNPSNVQSGSINSDLLGDAVVLGVKSDYTLWIWGSTRAQSNGVYDNNSNTTFASVPLLVGSNTQVTIGTATAGGSTIVLKNG